MTKEQLRVEMKAVASEMDLSVKYERGSVVNVPRSLVERWAKEVRRLSEDDLLWT